MSTSMLTAASQDRKARLAQLKSLKRKASPDTLPSSAANDDDDDATPSSPRPLKSPRTSSGPADGTLTAATTLLISGRNYDPETKGPRLGFEHNPAANAAQPTIEARAAQIAAETVAARLAAEEKDNGEDGGAGSVDLFALRPRERDWDLKRELGRRMERVNVKTERAIAGMVRERVREQREKERARQKGGNGGGSDGADGAGEAVGLDGTALVEATREREREDEEDARREREAEAELEEL